MPGDKKRKENMKMANKYTVAGTEPTMPAYGPKMKIKIGGKREIGTLVSHNTNLITTIAEQRFTLNMNGKTVVVPRSDVIDEAIA